MNFYKEKDKTIVYGGSCGSNWDRLKYFGTITVMELEFSSKKPNFTGDYFLGCDNITVSSNGGKTSLVLGLHRSPNQLLSESVFILERK